MIRTPLAVALAMALAPPVSAQPADPAYGRNLASACANCHGTNGASRAGMPSLAGRDRAELAKLMLDFRSGRREATVMHQIAKGYTDEQIEAMAAYLSAQKAR